MLKSCRYCGRIHDESIVCPQLQASRESRRRYKNTHRGRKEDEDAFRSSTRWRKLRDLAYRRDRCLCLCCLAGIGDTRAEYNTDGLEVHHIAPLRESYEERGSLDNLITVCRKHHNMCESGEISRDIQRRLVEWSDRGYIDLKERLELYQIDENILQ